MNDWKTEFRHVWDRGCAAWEAGCRTAEKMFSPADTAFLASLGCSAQELFYFIDDAINDGDVDFETTLAVTEIRRHYFLQVLHGKPTGRIVETSELPAKSAKVDGIAWLPR